ncbi:hypothetical protein CEK28_11820 [Xenophilus sp. AP218F]|nr:OmpA family protein [Chromobacterium sp. ASV5]OWY38770.1 hypothetical protein CEK28_11820 [Xenophilus sp. AP218F]
MQKLVSCLVAVTLSATGLTGCANMSETQKGTGSGAAIGAGVGAVIGALTAGGHTGRSAATGAAIGAALGAGGGYLWSQHMQKQKEAMEQATKGTGIDVSRTPDNQLKLNVPSDASFDSGRYAIKPNLRPVLDKLAVTLQQNTATTINIIGHTDNTGSDAINNPLSVNRAKATRDYLIARGVSGERIGVDGRGSREPIADNASTAGRAKNRRIEIFVAEPASK